MYKIRKEIFLLFVKICKQNFRKEYQQLVFSGLVDQQTRVQLLPPCIIKPYPLWSGKQVSPVITLMYYCRKLLIIHLSKTYS